MNTLCPDLVALIAIHCPGPALFIWPLYGLSTIVRRSSIPSAALLKWIKCPIDSKTIKCAARGGHLDVIKYMYSIGYTTDRIGVIAAQHGHIHILQWLCDHGTHYPGTHVCRTAARHGHVHILEWLHETIDHFDCMAMRVSRVIWEEAVMAGQLHVLKWMDDACGGIHPQTTCRYAAQYEHIHIITWCLENGAVITERMCNRSYYNLEFKTWLRHNRL